MPDLPQDTIVLNIPIDGESLPQHVIVRLSDAKLARHNFASMKKEITNQDVINLFAKVFDGSYIEVITRAGLSGIFSARKAAYSGVDVEALTLEEAERRRIIAAM